MKKNFFLLELYIEQRRYISIHFITFIESFYDNLFYYNLLKYDKVDQFSNFFLKLLYKLNHVYQDFF